MANLLTACAYSVLPHTEDAALHLTNHLPDLCINSASTKLDGRQLQQRVEENERHLEDWQCSLSSMQFEACIRCICDVDGIQDGTKHKEIPKSKVHRHHGKGPAITDEVQPMRLYEFKPLCHCVTLLVPNKLKGIICM